MRIKIFYAQTLRKKNYLAEEYYFTISIYQYTYSKFKSNCCNRSLVGDPHLHIIIINDFFITTNMLLSKNLIITAARQSVRD